MFNNIQGCIRYREGASAEGFKQGLDPAFLPPCPHLGKGEKFHITPCYEGGFPFYFFPLEVPSFFPPS